MPKRYHQAASELLDALERDPQIEIVLLTEELYQQALVLFRSRLDKEWGLIDCVSFVVMQRRSDETHRRIRHWQTIRFLSFD